MSRIAKVLIAAAVFTDAAFWLWLVQGMRHDRYPVTFIGWMTVILDPIAAFILLMALLTERKNRS